MSRHMRIRSDPFRRVTHYALFAFLTDFLTAERSPVCLTLLNTTFDYVIKSFHCRSKLRQTFDFEHNLHPNPYHDNKMIVR